MNQNDINRIFTEKVTELIAQGFQINPATMSGSQGEIGKIDLRKGTEIIRILLTSNGGYGNGPDYIRLIVGRNTDEINVERFDSLGNTIWDNHLEIISEIKFAKIAHNYFTDMDTGMRIVEKQFERWMARKTSDRRELGEAYKSIALEYVRKQPRMKSCKLSEIESVARVNRRSYGKVLPELYGYEIKAKGRTFMIKAPRTLHDGY